MTAVASSIGGPNVGSSSIEMRAMSTSPSVRRRTSFVFDLAGLWGVMGAGGSLDDARQESPTKADGARASRTSNGRTPCRSSRGPPAGSRN